MQEKMGSRFWIYSCTCLGMALVAYSWPNFFNFYTFKANEKQILATVVSQKGTTEWISRKTIQNLVPKKSSKLKMNESLSTGSDGEIVLRFKKGAEIRILPSSFVTLIRKANSTLLALRRGDVEVIEEGEQRSVLISFKGLEQPLKNYYQKVSDKTLFIDPQNLDSIKSVELSKNNSLPQTQTNDSKSDSVPQSTLSSLIEGSTLTQSQELVPKLLNTPNSEATLTSIDSIKMADYQTQIRSMISERIGKQKNHLFRCYSSLIQKNKTLQGKLDLHFKVSSLGKVEEALIVKNDLRDKKFESCLIQVIMRTEFIPFKGPTVSTFLPLRFEKNLPENL